MPPPRLGAERIFSLLIAVLIVAMVGVVVQAVRADRARQETAERALRDYAAIAAWRFARSAELELHDVSQEISRPLTGLRARSGMALPDAGVLLPVEQYSTREAIPPLVRAAFRLTVGSQALQVDGGELPPPVETWLRTHLPNVAARGGWDTHRSAHTVIGGEALGVYYRIVRSGEEFAPHTIFGVVVASDGIAKPLSLIHRAAELLPRQLAGTTPQSGAIGIEVLDGGGHVVYSRGPRNAGAVAEDSIGANQGGFVVRASLSTDLVAAAALSGGSRFPPGAAAVLVLASVLLGALAILQLRRSLELARLREQFVASVSHELRTPLTQISLFGETLMHARERSEEERRYFAGVIFREARRLTALVEGILRFSRTGAGPSRLEGRDLNVQRELEEAVETFAPIAAAAGATVALEVDPAVKVFADPAALRQVLLNLLDNAVKYGPPGQCIAIAACRTDGQVDVSVADEGPGIAESDRRRVFDPFVRLNGNAVAGTGIGLSVVRSLVSAMNGDVRVESASGSGEGTRFVVSLPAAAITRNA